ncbi:MAG: serine/threonine-protein phosphatase [Deltaproteobacteria bacterium]|nr:serine/threonine-protein phosphatase [Deltaproteobacteria bacterium]
MRVVWSCRTDVGIKRTINEDNHRANPAELLFLVADGMGGHAGGELASRLAVEIVERFVIETRAGTTRPLPFAPQPRLSPESNRLHVATRLANREIYDMAVTQPPLRGMGSTLVGLLLHGREAHVVHVGDSRCYRLREDKLQALTKDHSVVNALIDGGQLDRDAAYRHADRNIITRALGVDPDVEPEVSVHELRLGDLFVLCSDGLTDRTSDRKLSELLEPLVEASGINPGRSEIEREHLEQVAEALVRYANSRGGDDNITAMLIKVIG